MEKNDKILVTSNDGMIGSAIQRRLEEGGFSRLMPGDTAELDLTDQKAVIEYFQKEKPDYVFLNSSRVGGILANSRYPAEFIYTNIMSQTNVIHAAWQSGVKKLLHLGSSCIYPKDCPQPMKEEYLLDGKLEPTSEPYAIAKIAGIRMCQAYDRQFGTRFISAVPADVYGPDDDFDPETGHVLPALIHRMHHARIHDEPSVTIWGSGSPRREALHVDDLADACVFLMKSYDKADIINIGSGEDISIRELAEVIRNTVGFRGNLVFDKSKPDGTPRKLLDTRQINQMGWSARIKPENGIKQTYQWYTDNCTATTKLPGGKQ